MVKPRLTKKEIQKIIYLRKRGNTLGEIMSVFPNSRSTIYRYIKDVAPYKKFENLLSGKIHGTKNKSLKEMSEARKIIDKKIGLLSKRDLILIAGMIYWGEGNKKYELNLINSDPFMVDVFMKGLLALGLEKKRVRISLRLYNDIDESFATNFWLKHLGLNKEQLISIEWVEGKKKGKLPYGMCRLRVEKGSLYFKQLISIIDHVKGRYSSMDRTRSS